jgi:hypothetical protein
MKTLALAIAAFAASLAAGCTIVPARPVVYYPPQPVYTAPPVVIAAPPPVMIYGPPVLVRPPRPWIGYGGHRHYRRY